MTETDIALIEAELGVSLPPHYREFVLAYPMSLYEAKFAFDDEPAAASFLFDNSELVIGHNQEVREPGLLMLNNETAPWPNEYLIVGVDAGGNCWCVKLGSRSKAVWFFDHEEGAFERASKSLSEHVRYALWFIEEFNRAEQ